MKDTQDASFLGGTVFTIKKEVLVQNFKVAYLAFKESKREISTFLFFKEPSVKIVNMKIVKQTLFICSR